MRLLKWLPLALCTSVQATPQIESACARTGLLYAHYADSGQTEEFAALFAEDAVWQISSGVYQGRAAIAAQVSASRDGQPRMRHVITNQLITVESATRARGTAYFTLYAGSPDSASLTDQPIMVGSYIDEYVLEGADCLFKRRTSQVVFHRPPED
jgi:hypothetical protein